MPKPQAEEQFPLLLVLVGEQELSQNNKRFFGRGRLEGITSGASAIITEWPNYLSSCWLLALICGITLFVASILLTSCMTLQTVVRPPRCTIDDQIPSNRTIHLVHTLHKWSSNQLDLLKRINDSHLSFQIRLLIIDGCKPKESNLTQLDNKTDLIKDLATVFPNITVAVTSYKDIFQNSPLFFNWITLSKQTKIFAVRVIQLWQYGGLSYDLLDHKKPKSFENHTNLMDLKVRSYIENGHKRFERMAPQIVSVDRNGLHMEAKVPCHAFFGKVLTKLRRSSQRATPRSMLNGVIYTFCRLGAVDKDFCLFKNILF